MNEDRTAVTWFCGSVLSLVKKCCAFSSQSMRIAGVILPGPSVGGTLCEGWGVTTAISRNAGLMTLAIRCGACGICGVCVCRGMR